MATRYVLVKEDSVHYSHLLNALVSNLDEEALSPEVVAWADSCLINDVDASTVDWSSVKDALLEILSSQSEPTANSSVPHSSMEVTTADEILGPPDNLTSVEFRGGFDKDEASIDEDSGEVESTDISEDDHMVGNNNKRSRRRRKGFGNVFRPNYSEDVKVQELDFDLNLNPPSHEVDPFVEDIFRVWDLGISVEQDDWISVEQDDFTKQLDKALDSIPPQSPSSVTDSTAFNDTMQVSIDDLIAGIDDMSLKQNTE